MIYDNDITERWCGNPENHEPHNWPGSIIGRWWECPGFEGLAPRDTSQREPSYASVTETEQNAPLRDDNEVGS